MEVKNESFRSILNIKNVIRPITERIDQLSKPKLPLITNHRMHSLNNKKSILNSLKKQITIQETPKHKFCSELYFNTPSLTCEAWGAFDGNTSEIILGKNYTTRREIASLTKIMTCYTVIQLSRTLRIDMKSQFVVISKKAAYINGTKAELETGDKITVHDLLYGLMLPSGNDAALALSDFFGRLLFEKAYPNNLYAPHKVTKFFITEMNKNASLIGMKRTTYTNPHGLADKDNKSTVLDLGLLTCVAMKDELFRNIVKTPYYIGSGFDINNETKEFEWANRNLLLDKGFNGVKTGTTPTAGNCLCSSIERNGKFIIMIVLSAKSQKARFSETKKLSNYLLSNYDGCRNDANLSKLPSIVK